MASATRESGKELTFVLIGALGSGKSSTGNSILGEKKFKVSTGTLPVTNGVKSESVSRNDVNITVVDTPGLENTSSLPIIKDEIDGILRGIKPTNIIYLIIIKIGRYTTEERQILKSIFKNHREITENVMMIFTNRNDLMYEDDPEDRKVQKWIETNPTILKLINDYKLKHCAFENKRLIENEKDQQVKDLLSVVDDIDKKDVIATGIWGKTIMWITKTIGQTFGQSGHTIFEERILKQYNK